MEELIFTSRQVNIYTIQYKDESLFILVESGRNAFTRSITMNYILETSIGATTWLGVGKPLTYVMIHSDFANVRPVN